MSGKRTVTGGRLRADGPTMTGAGTAAGLALRRPLPLLLLGALALGALMVPLTGLRLGLPGDQTQPVSRTSAVKTAVATISDGNAGTKGAVSVAPARFDRAAADAAVSSAVPATSPTDENTGVESALVPYLVTVLGLAVVLLLAVRPLTPLP